MVTMPAINQGREVDAIYFWHPGRTGIRVERVYEHSVRAQERPRSWRGPFATATEARDAAERTQEVSSGG